MEVPWTRLAAPDRKPKSNECFKIWLGLCAMEEAKPGGHTEGPSGAEQPGPGFVCLFSNWTDVAG